MSSCDIPNASGIYRITCTATSKFYIGSAVNLRNRSCVHFHGLRNNIHHSITLQRAFNKYGEASFTFEVIELVLTPFLLEREQYWLDTLLPFGDRGYNIDTIAGSRIGHEVSPATREKLRVANLGKKHDEETIRKLTEKSTGRNHSPETKEKVRLIRLGTKRSAETCERLRISHLGKTQSPETIEKRRAAHMKTLIVTSPDGEVFTIHGIKDFCKDHGLNCPTLIQVAKGKRTHHKGWKACYPEAS